MVFLRQYILSLALVLLSGIAAATPTFSVTTSQLSNGKFSVVYVVKNAESNPNSFSAPAINGCTLLFGPTTSHMVSHSNNNGRVTASSRIEYTYIYKAPKPGTYTIPPASVVVGGKRLTTQASKVTISNGSSAGSSSSGGRVSMDDPTTRQTGAPISSKDLFVRIILSKSVAYENEAIECTIKLYTKYGVQNFIATQQPIFDGFIAEELPIQSALNQIETVNGERYFTAELKRCILFPQKSGKLTIRSGNYDLEVEQYDIYDLDVFSVTKPQYRSVKITSNTASADIKPLPSPRPAGFTGAVGDFKVSTRLSATTFRTNEPASLIYSVSGSGNLRYISDPAVDFPAEFEQYSPEHNVDANVVGNNVSGSTTTTLTFVPNEPGNFTIDVPDFVYFNPATAEYVTIPGQKFPIKVARGSASASSEQRDISAKNTDILYIKPQIGSLSFANTYLISTWWYWLLIVIIPVASFAGYRIYKQSRAKSSQPGKRIGRDAERSLKKAQACIRSNNRDEFYLEVSKALYGYIASRLNIGIADLNKENITERMASLEASPELIQSLLSLLDTCELARFTPESAESNLRGVYEQAASIIGQLSKLKIKK